MTELKPLPARALELARDPHLASNKDIRSRLKQEGYLFREIEAHFVGRGFRKQIKALRQGSMQSANS